MSSATQDIIALEVVQTLQNALLCRDSTVQQGHLIKMESLALHHIGVLVGPMINHHVQQQQDFTVQMVQQRQVVFSVLETLIVRVGLLPQGHARPKQVVTALLDQQLLLVFRCLLATTQLLECLIKPHAQLHQGSFVHEDHHHQVEFPALLESIAQEVQQ